MKQLPYSINTDKKIIYPAENWCKEQWGPEWSITNRKGIWCVFWSGPRVPNEYNWHFANEEQMMWFMLRWS